MSDFEEGIEDHEQELEGIEEGSLLLEADISFNRILRSWECHRNPKLPTS